MIASPVLGIVSDHIGPEKVLVGGLAAAAMLPVIQVLMTRYVPQSTFGRIFSYNQSFQAMGSVIGPMLGSVVTNAVGYSGVFVMTAVLEGVNMVLLAPVMWGMRKETHAQANHAFEK